ncbi:MAG: hypothetical protein MUE72_08070 [Chitinophagaceae bacterium]|nr:hypothetical protein [Chitinophagaceae bacterium]
MKKKVLIFVILSIFFSTKHLIAQTTLQDYNYVSKGLLEDLNNGRDIKEGYKLVSSQISGQVNRGDGSWRNAEIHYFKKKSNNKTQAFAVECKDNAGNRRFICIPVGNSSNVIWETTFKDLNNTGCEWHSVFTWAFAKLIGNKIN